VLNGAAYDLEAESGYCGRYRVRGAPGVYVERRNELCGNGSTANRTSDYWIVRVEGTTYRLGYTTNSEADIKQGYNLLICHGYCSPDPDTFGATRWRVDTVTDPLGNRMAFTYREKSIHPGDFTNVERSMLTEIRYNNYETSQWASKVVFVPVSGDVDSDNYMRVKRIDVYHLGTRIRQVRWTADKANWGGYSEWALWSIQEFSGDGSESLPPVEIHHTALPNYNGDYPFRRVSAVNLGYGGGVAFTYESDGRAKAGCTGCDPEIGYSYRVVETQTFDGISSTPARVTYAYGTRCYDQTNGGSGSSGTNGGALCRGAHPENLGPLVGHSWVTATAFDFDDTPVVTTTHRYYIDDNNSWKRGREYQAQVYDGGGTPLQQSDTTWAGDRDFNYVSQIVSTDYTGSAPLSTTVTYTYDPALQGGVQYGNLTHVREYGDGSAPYRTTVTTYTPNPDPAVWIVGKPQEMQVYAGDAGGTLLGWTQSYYDGSAVLGAPPISGTLTMARQVNPLTSTEVVEVEYAYDAWGNLTDVWDPLDHNIHIAYESTYHLYPITATNALDQHRTVEYYGVNAPGAPSGGGLPGQVWRVWDDNGAATATHYTYDKLGRLRKVIRPGDTLDLPTVEYDYDLFTEAVFFDDFETNCTLGQRPAGWKLWETNAACQSGGAYSGSWYVHMQDGGTAGAMFTSAQLAMEPGSRYLTRLALKGSGTIQVNLPLNEGVKYPITAAANGSWRVVEGSYITGGNPGDGKLHIWRVAPDDLNADVDYVEIVRVQGLRVTVRQRETSGQAGTLDSYVYYDGLGRQVQARGEAEGGQWTVASTGYDALGRPARGYLPSFGDSNLYAAPDGPYTFTDYDALGRVSWVDSPDGTWTAGFYEGRWAMAVDAKGRLHTSRSDVFGRLEAVSDPVENWRDTFDDGVLGDGWQPIGNVTEAGGVVRLTGDGTDGTQLYHHPQSLSDEQWHVFDFKLTPDSTEMFSIIQVDGGTWGQDSFRSWGLKVDNNWLVVLSFQGTTERPPVILMSSRADVWYRAVIKIGDDGKFAIAVWERDDPAVRAEWGEMTDSSFWSEVNWSFMALCRHGTLEIDAYTEVNYRTTADVAVTYGYDALDHLTTVTDTNGITTSMHYDGLGRKDWMDDPDMGHWTYDYDLLGNLKSQTDARGCTITFAYDELNRLERKTYGGTCSDTQAVNYFYDEPGYGYSLGRLTRMTDDSGSATWFYDARGRVTKEIKTIDAQTFETEYTYDAADRVTSMEYPDDEVVTYTYNDGGGLESLSGYAPYVQNIDYNPLGQITTMAYGNGVTTQYTYHPLNLRLERVLVSGHSQGMPLLDLGYTYDPVGNVQTITDDVLDVRQQFAYDDLDRLTRGHQEAITTTEQAIGEVGFIDDALTHEPYTVMLSRSYVNPVVLATPVSRDGGDTSVVRITDVQADRFTLYVHEGPDRDGAHTTEAVSWIVLEAGSWTLPDGTRLEVGQVNTSATVGGGVVDDTWAHVNLGSPFGAAPVVVSQVHTNSDPHWVKTRQQDVTPSGFDVALEEEDANTAPHGGEIVGWLAIAPGTGTWNGHKYEAAQTADVVSSTWAAISFAQSFAQAPRFVAGIATYDGGDGAYLRYDRTSLTASGVQVMIEEDTTADEETDHTDEVVHYLAIEGSGTLTGMAVTGAPGGPGYYDRTYAYDAIGNITSKSDMGAYTYQDPLHIHAVTHIDGVQRYAYDANGNMTQRDRDGDGDYDQALTFNAENKVAVVTEGGEETTFTYDGNGARVKKEDSSGTTYYVGGLYEKMAAGGVVTTTSYYYAGSQRVAMRTTAGVSTTVTTLHGDHLGSTSLTTDAAGALVARVLYYPYGETRYITGTLTTDYGFTGQRTEAGLGLMDYNARYYDPALGRFVSADTVVPGKGSQAQNRYMYVGGNPCKYRDPSGHCAEGDTKCKYEACVAAGNDPAVCGRLTGEGDGGAGEGEAESATDVDESASGPTPMPLVTPDNPWPLDYQGLAFEELPPQDQQAILELGVDPQEWTIESCGNSRSLAMTSEDPFLWLSFGVVGAVKWGPAIVTGVETGATYLGTQCLMNPICSSVVFGVGSQATSDTADDVIEWLGDDPVAIKNQNGDLIARNAENTLRFQAHFNNYYPHNQPHIHLDQFINGQWEAFRIFFENGE